MPPSPIPTAVKFHKRIRTVQAAGAAKSRERDGGGGSGLASLALAIAIGAEAGEGQRFVNEELSNDGIGCNI